MSMQIRLDSCLRCWTYVPMDEYSCEFDPTPGMLLHTLFLTFVSLHLPRPNYGSLNGTYYINQDGRVVKALDLSSNG